MLHRNFLLAAFLIAGLAAVNAAAQTAATAHVDDQTPGLHLLHFAAQRGRDSIDFAYALNLPGEYSAAGKPMPMVVFLTGAGESGNDHKGLFVHGPIAEITRNSKLGKSLHTILLAAQCPGDMSWEDADTCKLGLQIIAYAKSHWRVDPNRIYLTGLSAGGKGTWLMAEQAPQFFAAIAPISSLSANPGHAVQRIKGMSVWIINGSDDDPFTQQSQEMAAAAAKAGADVVHTVIPGAGHDVWSRYYASPVFYAWLLAHTRGQPASDDCPTFAQLMQAGKESPPQSKAEADFWTFLPYWNLLNCGPATNAITPGLIKQYKGKKNVFLSVPLLPDIPCEMQVSWPIPANKKTTLNLSLACADGGDWKLTVKVEGNVIGTELINADTAKNGWADYKVDMTPYAGRNVRIELLDECTNWEHREAYWGTVTFQSK